MLYPEVVAALADDAAFEAPPPRSFETQLARPFAAPPPRLGRATQTALFGGVRLAVDGVGLAGLCAAAPPPRVFLAHGSYGRAAAPTTAATLAWTAAIEPNPVAFYYAELYPRLVASLREAAVFVGARAANTVFVSNVEEGIACVLTSICTHVTAEKYRLLAFDFTYGACRLALERIAKERGCSVEWIKTSFPITRASITEDMRVHLQQNASVENGGPYRLALFEHITSPTALVLPIEELIHLCRKYGILSLVDGAHGIGQVDLKLDALKPDFYVTNTHKWLCHSRGCAILYISSEHHSKIKPLITSWGANQGLHAEFIWQGTADYAPYLSLPVTIKLFNWLSSNDLSSLYSRNCTLAQRAGNMLSHVWGTSLLSLDPDMFAAMVSVAVPVRQAMSAIDCGEEACGISDLHDDLINKFSIEVPVFTFKGRKYIRVSIHVYNCWDDVLKLASAVLNALGYQLGSDAFNRLQDYIREEDGTVDGENE